MKCIEKRVLFMGKRNEVTTRDIAEYTGVSQSTVSMILSNKPHVSFSKETIDKVRQGAKAVSYTHLDVYKRQVYQCFNSIWIFSYSFNCLFVKFFQLFFGTF